VTFWTQPFGHCVASIALQLADAKNQTFSSVPSSLCGEEAGEETTSPYLCTCVHSTNVYILDRLVFAQPACIHSTYLCSLDQKRLSAARRSLLALFTPRRLSSSAYTFDSHVFLLFFSSVTSLADVEQVADLYPSVPDGGETHFTKTDNFLTSP
jgi:hypothetical protein